MFHTAQLVGRRDTAYAKAAFKPSWEMLTKNVAEFSCVTEIKKIHSKVLGTIGDGMHLAFEGSGGITICRASGTGDAWLL